MLLSLAHASVLFTETRVQPENALRWSIRVRTTEEARVAAYIWPADGDRTEGWLTESTPTGTDGTLTVWGLRPSTDYRYQLYVQPTTGPSYKYTNHLGLITSPAPISLPSMSVTAGTGQAAFPAILFDSVLDDGHSGVVLVVDNEGYPVWYQEPVHSGADVEATAFDADSGTILAICDLGRVTGWGLDGEVRFDWTTNDVLEGDPHHEVQIHDDVVYVLSARASVVGGRSVVEDGILGYTADGTLVYEWWIAEDGGLDPIANMPTEWVAPGRGYWQDVFPDSQDWLHVNSMQVREEEGDLVAYLSLRMTSQVIRMDMATGTITWMLGANPTGSSDAAGDFSLAADGVSTDWWELQHHAHLEDDGLLYLFDNGDGTRTSRALAVSIDEASGEATIERSADFSRVTTQWFTGVCDAQSGVFRGADEHLLLSCGPSKMLVELDGSDQVVWSGEVVGGQRLYRATPIFDLN